MGKYPEGLPEKSFTESMGYPEANLGSGKGKRAIPPPVASTTANEEQDPKDIEREYSVLIGSKKIKFVCDDTGCSFVDPSDGHGLHIQKNGDIIIVSGGGGNGKLCGGRFMINTKGGVIEKHDGPKLVVAAANPNNPVNKSNKSTSPGKSGSPGNEAGNLACSELYFGDAITECHGEVRIRATNIVIEAADVLSLIGKGSVLIQAGPEGGGQLVINSGKTIETTSISETIVAGAKTTIAPEETTFQYDPRASVNVVSGGHMNIKAKGDISLGATGVMETVILGLPSTPPLVKLSRETGSAYSVRTAALPISLDAATLCSIKAAEAFSVIAGANASIVAGGSANINAGLSASMLGNVNVNMIATEGNVNLVSVGGNVNVKGMLIYLN